VAVGVRIRVEQLERAQMICGESKKKHPAFERKFCSSVERGAAGVRISQSDLAKILRTADHFASKAQLALRHNVIGRRLGYRLYPATVILNRSAAAAVPPEKRFARRIIGTQRNVGGVSR
jgi:hypothetical protein